jgi:hypothetical protein
VPKRLCALLIGLLKTCVEMEKLKGETDTEQDATIPTCCAPRRLDRALVRATTVSAGRSNRGRRATGRANVSHSDSVSRASAWSVTPPSTTSV